MPASDEQSVAGASVPSGRSRFSWKKLGAAVAPLGVVPVLVWIGIPLCPSRSMFGVPCPGCGLSRATIAMLELDFGRVLEMHPMAPLVAPLVAWWMVSAILTSAGLKSAARWDPGKILPRWFWGALGVAMIGLYVVRLGGMFGGLPDRFDPASGLFGRVALAIASLFGA